MERFGMALACWLLFGAVAFFQETSAGQVAAHWGQWRGPTFNGVAAKDATPPLEWSEEKNIRWKVAIPGQGYSTPIVWEDKLFLLTARPTKESATRELRNEDLEPVAYVQRGRGNRAPRSRGTSVPRDTHEFLVMCLDRHTGETLWEQVARREVPHEGTHETNTFASSSPVTDGERLYASFGSRGIYCYDLDGEKLWEVDLGDMETRGGFGEGASPALHGQTLVVPWDHEGQSFVAALDALTGDQLWRVERDEASTWATPLVLPRGDGHQVVLNGSTAVRSYDLKTGTLLWECGGQAMNPIPSPVADSERVYVMTGFRGHALYAIPLDAEGDVTDSDTIAWSINELTPYISSPALHEGLLYITKERTGILSCIEAETGEAVYKNQRLPGISTLYASPILANGHLYIFGRDGAAVVVKAGRDFEIVAENQLEEGIDASPVMIGDVMYVRGASSLYCIAAE